MKIIKANLCHATVLSTFIPEIIKNVIYYNDAAKKQECKEYQLYNIRKLLIDKNHIFLISTDKTHLTGFLHGYKDMGTFWINWIGVFPNFRKQGIGCDLIGSLEKRVRRHNIHKIWFGTIMYNTPAIKFFTNCGYHIITNLRRHWYKSDFYIWEKEL